MKPVALHWGRPEPLPDFGGGYPFPALFLLGRSVTDLSFVMRRVF